MAKVESVLAALAADRWDDAASALTPSDGEYTPLAALLGEDGPLADRLEAYCRTRICDAPHTITGVRGSYLPDRVRPAVDVEFRYPGGTATQTFHRVNPESPFTIDSLPGQSILAFRAGPADVADLVDPPVAADAGLYRAAEEIRRALLSERGPRIPERYLPDEGLVVSTDAYVDPVPANRNVVTPAQLSAGDGSLRIWGYTDGVGAPIVNSVDRYLSGYRRAPALLEPDIVGVDRRVGLGNTIANLGEVFPDSRVVEFHRRGRGELVDFNWSSLRIALEDRDGQWKLVAITSDSWTI